LHRLRLFVDAHKTNAIEKSFHELRAYGTRVLR
jgi:hypothetical protein